MDCARESFHNGRRWPSRSLALHQRLVLRWAFRWSSRSREPQLARLCPGNPGLCFKLLRNGKLSLQNLAISAVALLFLVGALVGSLNTGSSGPGKWLAPVYVTLLMLGCVYKALWH